MKEYLFITLPTATLSPTLLTITSILVAAVSKFILRFGITITVIFDLRVILIMTNTLRFFVTVVQFTVSIKLGRF